MSEQAASTERRRIRPERDRKRVALQRRAVPREARVRFLEGRHGVLSVLEVDLPRSCGVERLGRALLAARIQEVSRQTHAIGDRVIHWLRVVEFDGGPIRETRRSELEVAMLSLLETVLAPRRRRVA
jgi:hypothetical protein